MEDLKNYSIKASPEEQGSFIINYFVEYPLLVWLAFLDKEVQELCEILDDYKITADRDMPEEFWNRCKKQGYNC